MKWLRDNDDDKNDDDASSKDVEGRKKLSCHHEGQIK